MPVLLKCPLQLSCEKWKSQPPAVGVSPIDATASYRQLPGECRSDRLQVGHCQMRAARGYGQGTLCTPFKSPWKEATDPGRFGWFQVGHLCHSWLGHPYNAGSRDGGSRVATESGKFYQEAQLTWGKYLATSWGNPTTGGPLQPRTRAQVQRAVCAEAGFLISTTSLPVRASQAACCVSPVTYCRDRTRRAPSQLCQQQKSF